MVQGGGAVKQAESVGLQLDPFKSPLMSHLLTCSYEYVCVKFYQSFSVCMA